MLTLQLARCILVERRRSALLLCGPSERTVALEEEGAACCCCCSSDIRLLLLLLLLLLLVLVLWRVYLAIHTEDVSMCSAAVLCIYTFRCLSNWLVL
jgi:hypothetical protein